MSAALNSSDQKGFNLGLPKDVTGPGIQENNRLNRQQNTEISVERYAQLKESNHVQDQRFFDPVADFVKPSAVYLIPTG